MVGIGGWRPFLVVFLLWLTVLGAVGASQQRILCIGDSITQADADHYSYRYVLWKMLVDEGIDFDFVGAQRDHYGGVPNWPVYKGHVFDRDHEGHWGYRVDQVLAGLPVWLAGYAVPDIALIHIGSNDMYHGEAHESTKREVGSIITVLRDRNPSIKIILCTLIPWRWLEDGVRQLNLHLAEIPGEMGSVASPIVLVDQFSGFDPFADSYDGIHPNSSGELKMAQRFFAALRPLLEPEDSDGDFMPDAWERAYFSSLAHDGTADDDVDGYSDLDEYVIGSDPTNPVSSLGFGGGVVGGSYDLRFWTAPGRFYEVESVPALDQGGWTVIDWFGGKGGYTNLGYGLTESNGFYRVRVSLEGEAN